MYREGGREGGRGNRPEARDRVRVCVTCVCERERGGAQSRAYVCVYVCDQGIITYSIMHSIISANVHSILYSNRPSNNSEER